MTPKSATKTCVFPITEKPTKIITGAVNDASLIDDEIGAPDLCQENVSTLIDLAELTRSQ